MKSLFLILTAILPAIILFYIIYKKDKIEKEPIHFLIILFCLGILGTLFTMILNNFLKNHFLFFNIPLENWSIKNIILHSFITIASIEEFVKWIIVIVVAWRNNNFNYTYDAILYSVVVALGFASIENIFYVLNYGFLTGLFRGILSVPGHAFFGVFAGYYLGKAKLNKKANYFIKSLLIPILLHGIYDTLLLLNNTICYIIFFIFLIALYIISILKINDCSLNDTKIK